MAGSTIMAVSCPVLKICFGPPTAESKNLKNHVNFDVGDLFFRSPDFWSSQNVFGPPTAGRVVVDFKDRVYTALSNQCNDLIQKSIVLDNHSSPLNPSPKLEEPCAVSDVENADDCT